MKARKRIQLKKCLSPSFICIFTAFSIIRAWGYIASLHPGDTIGNALLNAFGGCIWAEEIDIHEIISWIMMYIPIGIAACIITADQTSGLMLMEGYRYRSVLQWYVSFSWHLILTVCIVIGVQIICVILLAAMSGYTGFTIWVNDADGFIVQSFVQPCLSPLLFLLYGEVMTLSAAIVLLASRKMTWYYTTFLLPSIIGCITFSNPGRTSLLNPIHFGMARRLSVADCYGVQPMVACIGLLAILIIVLILGGVYCRLSTPFDHKNV